MEAREVEAPWFTTWFERGDNGEWGGLGESWGISKLSDKMGIGMGPGTKGPTMELPLEILFR